MFKKLISKWKEEWWEKKSESLAKEYAEAESALKAEFSEHLEKDKASFNLKLEELQFKGQEIEKRLARLEVKHAELSEMERLVADRKERLAHVSTELLDQIRIAEAKSSPSSVFMHAFTLGASKTWDLLLPVMTGNIEALRKKIYEDATSDAISRMNTAKKNGIKYD